MATRRKKEGDNSELLFLKQRHVEMVDDYIEDERVHGLLGQDKLTGGKLTGKALAGERRRVIGGLVAKHLSFESLHPVKATIIFPSVMSGTADEMEGQADEAVKWAKAEEKRLTESAPESVQDGFGYNKLARLKRSDPAKFRRVLADTLKRGD